MKNIEISFVINGIKKEMAISPNTTLLELLRDHLGLTGTKKGCEIGECGTCTVLLDGKPVNACLVLAPKVDEKEITTIEGIGEQGKLHPLQCGPLVNVLYSSIYTLSIDSLDFTTLL